MKVYNQAKAQTIPVHFLKLQKSVFYTKGEWILYIYMWNSLLGGKMEAATYWWSHWSMIAFKKWGSWMKMPPQYTNFTPAGLLCVVQARSGTTWSCLRHGHQSRVSSRLQFKPLSLVLCDCNAIIKWFCWSLGYLFLFFLQWEKVFYLLLLHIYNNWDSRGICCSWVIIFYFFYLKKR